MFRVKSKGNWRIYSCRQRIFKMQKSFNINSSSGSYAISVEQDILQELSKANKDSL